MMTVTRILVPVDFSEPSGRALDCAKTLAEKFSASLHLLTVVPDPFTLPNPSQWYVPAPGGYVEGLRRDAEIHVNELLNPDEHKRFEARDAVLFGDAPEKILEYVGIERIDMIVMGTHGRGGVARALLGSVAERIVRAAPCPVLIVR